MHVYFLSFEIKITHTFLLRAGCAALHLPRAERNRIARKFLCARCHVIYFYLLSIDRV
jgi:hypothetical protein